MDNTASPTRVVISNGKGQIVSRWNFIPSFTTILLIMYFIICLLMNGDFTPLIRRGFFCNDSSINKPFRPDTIGIKTLFFFALLLPGFVIKICDKSYNRLLRKSLSQDGQEEDLKPRLMRKRRKVSDDVRELDLEDEELISSPNVAVKRRNLLPSDSSESDLDNNNADLKLSNNAKAMPTDDTVDGPELQGDDDDEETDLFTRVPLDSDHEQSDSNKQLASNGNNSLRAFGEFHLFFFGLCTTMLFTGIGKITCGRLRPHFLQRCQPNIKCSTIEESTTYVEEFTCTNSKLTSRDYSYITTSWPSGHASIMFYSMLYLILYLNNVIPVLIELNLRKVRQRYDPLIMYAVYVLMFAFAGFIAMTRIWDYHHHPLDVASGSILGSTIAFVVAKTLTRQYSQHGISRTHLQY